MQALDTVVPSPNADVISFWQDVMVEKYRRFRRVLVGTTALHTSRAHSLHEAPLGARVLDVGCGFGETTIDWARRVGPRGEVVGLDPCADFLSVARADARAAGVTNVSFRSGDGQTVELYGLDRVFSAFGVMFFAQPVAALRNLRATLNPGGRMQLLVWNNRAQNPWLSLAIEACERVLPPTSQPGATCGPGPFSMSDPTALGAMLVRAGLTRIELQQFEEDVFVGADLESAVDFQLALGPAGERMRLAGASGTPMERRIRDEVMRLLEPHRREDGVWLRSSVWYATGVAR
jgi:ubiquinone/menaquinone biosynthesis C-methylase UbiE